MQYGIVKKKDNKSVMILTNDGKSLWYRFKPNETSNAIHLNDRVKFFESNDRVTTLQKLHDSKANGEVIWLFPDGGGLVLTQNGETLFFTEAQISDNHILPEIGQKIQCTAAASSDENARFGIASDLRFPLMPTLTEDVRNNAAEVIHREFENGKVLVSDLLDVLSKAGITPQKFGYSDNLIFLEEFTDTLRIQHESCNAFIFHAKETIHEYDSVLQIAKKIGYTSLTPLQERAVRDPAFWQKKRILVMGTTSAGKTMVPMFKYIHNRESTGKKLKMLIAVPYRALATQMHQSLREKFHDYGLDIACSTSEKSDRDTDICNGDVDIAIIIYEKLFIFLSENSRFLEHYDYLTLDEIGIIQEIERGIKAELIILHSLSNPNLHITMLATPYYNWDHYITQYDLYPIKVYNRPVKVHEYFLKPYNDKDTKSNRQYTNYSLFNANDKKLPFGHCYTFLKSLSVLCQNEFDLNHKVIIFCFSKKTARERAHTIYQNFKKEKGWHTPTPDERAKFKEKFLREYHLTLEELKGVFDSDEDFDALQKGITFHCASLPEAMRIAIESEFLNAAPRVIEGGIKIVSATETLAFGLNSNVDTIVIVHMKKAQMGEEEKYIEYNLYQNCIGRAGRLGFLRYGTSYTFIQTDMLKDNRFQNPVQFYCTKATIRNHAVQGHFSTILQKPNWKSLCFCILNLMSNHNPASIEEICSKIAGIPSSKPINKTVLLTEVTKALQFLQQEKLVCEADDDLLWDNENEQEHYTITRKGIAFKSYVISADSYHIIQDAVKCLFENNNCYILDYFLKLSECSEIEVFCRNLFIQKPERIEYADESALNDFTSFMILAETTLPLLYEMGYISENLYHSFFISDSYEQFQRIIENTTNEEQSAALSLSNSDYNYLTHFKIALYATLWISGYSLGLINDIAGWTNGRVDNIRSKFGEKMSYITDAAEIAVSSNSDTEQSELLKQISLALFYGIRLDWLRKENIKELQPDLARYYHLASIYSVRKSYLETNGTPDQIQEFDKEFSYLDDRVKKIIIERM